MFLSGRVSKIQRNLNVQISTFSTHETGRNFPLKCRSLWRSPNFCLKCIPLQCRAIVCQPNWGPLALIPLYHSNNNLVKSFSVFVTDFFWEKNLSVTPESGFSVSYGIPQLCTKSTCPAQHPDCSLLCDFLRKLANSLNWQPCISFSLIQLFIEQFVLHQFPDLGSYKYTFLDFCVTHIWEPIPHIFESTAGVIHTFHKVLHEAQLYIQRGQTNFLLKNKMRTDDIFLTWRQRCSFRPQFIYIVILLVPAVPLARETAVFCVPELHSE